MTTNEFTLPEPYVWIIKQTSGEVNITIRRTYGNDWLSIYAKPAKARKATTKLYKQFMKWYAKELEAKDVVQQLREMTNG